MSQPLVLSLFPGIGLLDMAFEEEGFCVVRGPDVLWGGDIRRFHPPAGVFDGVIGGPPCKGESRLARLNGTPGATMRHEFMRVVNEAAPMLWDAGKSFFWLMEAVKVHDDLVVGWPKVPNGFVTKLSNRWLGETQSRTRYFHSNVYLRDHVEVALFENPEYRYAVLAGHGGKRGTVTNRMASYTWEEGVALQGLPEAFDLPGFTVRAKREALGNGVPLPMGRAIARAVKRSMGYPMEGAA